MDDLEFLRGLEPFRTLSRRDAKRLLQGITKREYAPGTRIVRRGDPGDAMYVVREGRVEVPVLDEQGQIRFVAYLKAGDVFGEMALLTGEPRRADVIVSADAPATCLAVRKDVLDVLLAARPAVAAFLTEILGKRLLEDRGLQKVGKYRILGEIGRGAMATVFEGYHPDLHRGVAVKMLSHGMVYRSDFAKRFLREAEILGTLRHEGIVDVYDTEKAYGTYFLVMEKLEGTDLERVATREGHLPADEVRRIVVAVARALHYAHARGVVHRDVKPSNVFRLPDGRIKLVDFGIATGPVDASDEQEILCSPAYVAPEVVEGRPVDGRTDLYSLGIVAYRLLSGRLPFAGGDYQTLFAAHVSTPFPDVAREIPGIPSDLETFVRKATAKRPSDRFASGAEVEALFAPRLVRTDSFPRTAVRLTLRYPPEVADRVRTALKDLGRAVGSIPDVQFGAEELPPDDPGGKPA
jgi:CRP-like cAMP-binding protein/tRNA A-37 threonylcarbamoyl transferase component Bud32